MIGGARSTRLGRSAKAACVVRVSLLRGGPLGFVENHLNHFLPFSSVEPQAVAVHNIWWGRVPNTTPLYLFENIKAIGYKRKHHTMVPLFPKVVFNSNAFILYCRRTEASRTRILERFPRT